MLIPFLEYLSYEKKYSPNTITAYKTDLLAFKEFCVITFDNDDLVSVHYNQIRSWIVHLVNKGLNNRTINRKISSLKTFYKFLQKIGEITLNPLAKHKVLKVQKKSQIPFTKKEVNKVLDNFQEDGKDFISIRDKLIVELFYSTGIRRMELITIEIKDVDLNSKMIKVLGKRNKERYVPLLPSVINSLREYLISREEIAAKEQKLFITEKGMKIYETLVYRVIKSYFSQVSSKVKKSPHILRHTFATQMLEEGADLNSVKELLGHSSLASTQVYTHNSLEKMKKTFNNAHPRSVKNK